MIDGKIMKPISVLYLIAEHYHRDACEYATRFDSLWERDVRKTARMKTFVDLMMACECALKAHFVLTRLSGNPKDIYNEIRKMSHKINLLANSANFLQDRSAYDFLRDRLEGFSVFIRYSLDGYYLLFPAGRKGPGGIVYNDTIGSNLWVLEIRSCLDNLLVSVRESFSGLVTDDIDSIIEIDNHMDEILSGKKAS